MGNGLDETCRALLPPDAQPPTAPLLAVKVRIDHGPSFSVSYRLVEEQERLKNNKMRMKKEKKKKKKKWTPSSILYGSIADLVLCLPASTIGDSLLCAASWQ
jgi:hypothetical protein